MVSTLSSILYNYKKHEGFGLLISFVIVSSLFVVSYSLIWFVHLLILALFIKAKYVCLLFIICFDILSIKQRKRHIFLISHFLLSFMYLMFMYLMFLFHVILPALYYSLWFVHSVFSFFKYLTFVIISTSHNEWDVSPIIRKVCFNCFCIW
jgi:Zn-dependent protease with chaperone function